MRTIGERILELAQFHSEAGSREYERRDSTNLTTLLDSKEELDEHTDKVRFLHALAFGLTEELLLMEVPDTLDLFKTVPRMPKCQ